MVLIADVSVILCQILVRLYFITVKQLRDWDWNVKPATGQPYVRAFSLKSTCVCLRLREQCLRSEITSVARVAHVLLLRFVAGNMDVNTLASKRSQLIGNTAIVRKRCVIHRKSTCVCLRLSDAGFTRKRRDARFDLWPALRALTALPPAAIFVKAPTSIASLSRCMTLAML